MWQQDGAAVVASEKELKLLKGGDETKAAGEKKAEKVDCDAALCRVSAHCLPLSLLS